MQEFEFIKRCTESLPAQAEGLLCGIGDDCAVFSGNAGRDWLISTDGFIEGVHFRRDWMSPEEVGERCLAAAVSDIAAMGGRPRFLTIAIAIPQALSTDEATRVMHGITAAATAYQLVVIGGDTSGSPQNLQIVLAVIGECRSGMALYRRGARVGDVVYVTGALGGAQMGLELMQAGAKRSPVVDRFLHPIAHIATGQWLADTGCITSMIDVSDGLVQDLGHLARASGVGMTIDADDVPRWNAGGETAGLITACSSGEEYELAFTVDGRRDAAFQRLLPAARSQLGHPITRIGTVISGKSVTVKDATGQSLTPMHGGYQHAIGGAR